MDCIQANSSKRGSDGQVTDNPGMLTLDQLGKLVDAGDIDTVLVAITDMQGRLQGKRCAAEYFMDEVVPRTPPRRATTCSPSTST